MVFDRVSVKVYLMEEEKRIDVRRFNILKSMITSYEYLCERFQSSMRELKQRFFKLLWLDSDGDEVTITSDEELIIAISEFKDNVCKFTIRLEPISHSTEPTEFIEDNYDPTPVLSYLTEFLKSPRFCEQLLVEFHTLRACKSCSELITSTSLKCLQCPNYYQCNECADMNTHPNHIMLRISLVCDDHQLTHHEFYMGSQDRQAMNQLQNNQNHYEEGRKKRTDESYGKRGRREKKSSHKTHHILKYKKIF